ncbi:MAG: SMP-30/gluconolactonase/LRE family protein [Rhodothermaceae bacterium]|nr:SMP-30/gluconolactonase/LRE family protein [Rhodothermaceae bacterium]
MLRIVSSIVLLLVFAACQPTESPREVSAENESVSWASTQDASTMLFSVDGLSGPEAVRYDPDQDVYFVSNFNGSPSGDANGFISRVSAEGELETLEYMVGTEDHPLHGPRGMFIVDDVLWAADADGLHGFNRLSGAHESFIDFTSFEPGFLNDISQAPNGALYITDTGQGRVYRLMEGEVTIAIEDTLIGNPNGITWDADNERFVLAPWNGTQSFQSFMPGSTELTSVGMSEAGNFDGIEIVGGVPLIASQMDSTLRIIENGEGRPYIHLPGRPADIGIDTQRSRVAVPYVDLDRVDVWEIPE